jgi:sugar phosphate permease
MWGLCAVFYLVGFFQRVAPAVMTAELMSDFQVGAAGLGHLSAFYFYSYVAMQIPTGILSDRWGPRRLLSAGALVAAVGSLLFGLSSGMMWAGVGRLLVGGSVAVAFVGMLKMAAHWFPAQRYAMATGLALFSGVLGAVSAGIPLRWMVVHTGWRPVMIGAAVLSAGLALAIRIWVRDDPREKGFVSYAPASHGSGNPARSGLLAGLAAVFRYRNTWLLFLIPAGMVGCVLTFSGLWGVPFLTTHYNMSSVQAAGICSTLLVAWAVGGPVFGGLSDRLGRRKPLYVAGAFIAASGWTVLLYWPELSVSFITPLLILIGFATGTMVISFAFIKESVPPHLAGTAAGVINMGVMMGPMLLQPAIGWVLDRHWDGRMLGNARVYDLEAYQQAFLLMTGWVVLSFLLILFARETHCRPSA